MPKKGSRVAVLVKSNNLFALCVFRGKFLEKMFFETDIDELRQVFNYSSVKEEVKEIVLDAEKEEYCKSLLTKIERKLNKLLDKKV